MPIRFLANDVPIEAPTPMPPAPTEVAAETISAVIEEVLVDVTDKSRPEFKSLFWTLALVFDRITLVDSAPAPLTAMPTRPTPVATDDADALAVIVD